MDFGARRGIWEIDELEGVASSIDFEEIEQFVFGHRFEQMSLDHAR